jgi:hypothetical protein
MTQSVEVFEPVVRPPFADEVRAAEAVAFEEELTRRPGPPGCQGPTGRPAAMTRATGLAPRW